MAIYTRNKEGKLKALPIKAIKGENGIDGIDGVTPNIKIGEVTTLEAGEKAKVEIVGERENPVINFSIPKGKDGDVDGCEIKDGEISEEDTWSSDKITKWSMEQDGVHWVEKEDNFISVDNTYEYKLKEIEIFGDTWQDKDSKNLFDINSLQMVGGCAHSGIIDVEKNSITFNYRNTRDYGCETNFVFKSGKKYKISTDVEYNNSNIATRFICIGPAGSNISCSNTFLSFMANKPNFSERRFAITNTIIPDDGNQYVLYLNGNNFCSEITGSTVFKNIVIEEVDDKIDTTKVTEYIPYHKADLSNIQHAGELYVDKDGEPKLDDQGRKQYKFEIETVNKNLVKPNMEMINNVYNIETGELTPAGHGGRCTKEFIRVNSGGRYSYKYTSTVNPTWLRVVCFDDEYKYLGCPLGLIGTSSKNRTFDMPKNTKFIRIQHLNGDNISTSDLIIIKSDTVITEDIQHKSHKETILLPCQLMKVGDYKDRLYWDENKGKYIVEKNIISFLATKITRGILVEGDCVRFRRLDNIQSLIINGLGRCDIIDSSIYIAPNVSSKDWVDICVKNDFYYEQGYELTDNDANRFLKDYPVNIITILSTPELIETNITKPLYLPTYNNKTHAYITNTNNAKATIKAKFPLKTSNTLSTLSFESNKASNDILNLQDINVELVSNNFEMDFRVSEIEWNLEDRGLLTLHELLTNENISNKYNKDKMTYQLSKYLERNYIKQEEFDELVELMK